MRTLVTNCLSRNALSILNYTSQVVDGVLISASFDDDPISVPGLFFHKNLRKVWFVSVEGTANFVTNNGFELIIPIGTADNRLILDISNSGTIAGVSIAAPRSTLRQWDEKYRVLKFFEKTSLGTCCLKPGDIIPTDLQKKKWVLKPNFGSGSVGIQFLDPVSLECRYTSGIFCPEGEDILQEFIDGDVYDYIVLAKQGRILAAQFQQRDMVSENEFGGGIVVSVLSIPEQLKQVIDATIQNEKLTGIFMFELKGKNDDLKIIECNPKIFGTSEIFFSSLNLDSVEVIKYLFTGEDRGDYILEREDNIGSTFFYTFDLVRSVFRNWSQLQILIYLLFNKPSKKFFVTGRIRFFIIGALSKFVVSKLL